MPASRADQAAVAERRAQLIKLRRTGMRFEDPQILALGYPNRGSASKDFHRALAERREEQHAEASVYRQEENERLDALLEAVWPRATTPHPVYDREGDEVANEIDLKAVDTVLKLMDRRAKLMGLDMPIKAELSGPGGTGIPIGPVGLAQLRDLIDAAGDPDPDDEDDGLESEDLDDGDTDDDSDHA